MQHFDNDGRPEGDLMKYKRETKQQSAKENRRTARDKKGEWEWKHGNQSKSKNSR